MLKKRIIPCLDVHGGRVVKGTHFRDLRDAGDPLAQAMRYDQMGADELVFLDISATHEERAITLKVVQDVAEACFMPLTVGGGIKTIDDMRQLLTKGADKLSINSVAVAEPTIIEQAARCFGSQCVVVAIDVKRRDADDATKGWDVYTHGGRRNCGKDGLAWAKEVAQRGCGEILLTSMDRDGSGQGFDIDLLQQVSASVRVPLIASGGAGHPEHLVDALKKGGASAVLAASIFHFDQWTIPHVKGYMKERGIHVRTVPERP
ncbi:MAG: imidazole glycerol phosphate synthase subunit HisF [Alphaproteobacteria bacterium GM202ARS2]|nr:imidazole glycerol phosphate synthase subunit HisF [Alphaproteobacteria bacterium GM202ARS2]